MDVEIRITQTVTPNGPTGEYVVMAGEQWKRKDVILEGATFDQAVQVATEFLKNIKVA